MKTIVFGDLHLGHDKTSSKTIPANLKRFINKYKDTLTDVDLLVLNGDTFDKLLLSNSDNYIDAIDILLWVTKWCIDNDVTLVINEGTPSHDMGQPKIMNVLVSYIAKGLKFHYVTEATILNIKGENILMGIDYGSKPFIEVLAIFKGLLKKHNITSVSLAFLHGFFRYQLPDLNMAEAYNEEDMLSIVNGHIVISHFHVSRPNGRIIPPGSFDRIAHNEEGDKGAVLLDTKDGVSSYEFLVNKHAKKYITINTKATSIDGLKQELRRNYNNNPDSIVRFATDDVELRKTLGELKRLFPETVISFKSTRVKKKIEAKNRKVIGVDEITKDNIRKLLIDNVDLTSEESNLFSNYPKLEEL